MQTKSTPTLVFMRAGEEDGRTLFVADLYRGRLLQSSIYNTRSAMLDWIGHDSAELRHAAAQAMDQLAASPDALLRSVPLGSLELAGTALAGTAPAGELEASW